MKAWQDVMKMAAKAGAEFRASPFHPSIPLLNTSHDNEIGNSGRGRAHGAGFD